MTANPSGLDRRRKYATEEERLEAKSAQRRINDRKYYHQNPEAKIEKVKKYQAENQDKIKAKQREAYAQKKKSKDFRIIHQFVVALSALMLFPYLQLCRIVDRNLVRWLLPYIFLANNATLAPYRAYLFFCIS